MSGGVDSSVTAYLLKEQGHDVVGAQLTLWSDPLAPPLARLLPSKCCNTQTRARARSVAKKLGIALHTADLQQEFYDAVVVPFLDAYRSGRTPNPCVRCNRDFKHAELLKLADTLGCNSVATGHYARIAVERLPDDSQRWVLLEAVDSTKDQSYFLHQLDQDQLRRTLFPLGTLLKRQVYALAEHFGVPLEKETYRESQDLCFFPEKGPGAFLKRYLKDAMEPGEIARRDGTVVGMHQGLALYALGQRRIGVGGLHIPLEVVGKDLKTNRLIVEDAGTVTTRSISVEDLHWIAWKPEENTEEPFEYRTHSRAARRKGVLRYHGNQGTLERLIPAPPETPGQFLVLYRGEEVVGGGTMV
ncbi:tRNA 2-thiouridine(34) synthase MnmA [Candidatus Peregrinibacteria bacterium CG10_big_fil_rev_8_21_14_0_10_55_24]|nr:MAG: tRNA 2-thiouridine(34) synthase MnmA [Candidatus Peregrinibacteria bacterium CG10_big_fil_rev_8_21_14_0_10_55_24]